MSSMQGAVWRIWPAYLGLSEQPACQVSKLQQ